MQAEGHRALQVFQVFLVPAHGFARGVGQLGDGAAVDGLQLDDDVQRLGAGIVGAEGADAEGHLTRPLK